MNQKLIDDFTEYMINSPQSTIPVIKFYEWSNLDSKPLLFASLDKFKAFLMSSNITWTKEDEKIMTEESCYCACPKDSPTLICKKYMYQLRDEINGKKTTPYMPSAYSPYSGMNNYWKNYYD